MLREVKNLIGGTTVATDGEIGKVANVYFDDEQWTIRYLVVDTGTWLGRKVLVSPMLIDYTNWDGKILSLLITKEEVENSPDVNTDKPVSRQHELEHLGFYGYPSYWGGSGLWGMGMSPSLMIAGELNLPSSTESTSAQKIAQLKDEHKADDHHLRSCAEVVGYHIHATDGDIGHVTGFVVDEETWAIRYMIVDTSNWWLGHQMLIAPDWILKVGWAEHKISIDITRSEVKESPAYVSGVQIERIQELAIFNHYGRKGYWEKSDTHTTSSSQEQTK
jgi:sporulation protein YlmC with PRC-barrel domain